MAARHGQLNPPLGRVKIASDVGRIYLSNLCDLCWPTDSVIMEVSARQLRGPRMQSVIVDQF